ncbi:hypothetical protein H4J59_01240 [Colwellia sp. MB02u-10]|jgi:hypothetical protein|uniref:hypothetical protein n=1 Tax=unclassified Colwellia TaxID=196834 RepID=UPI0015F58DDB|nr:MULTISPECIES: hypothetical protein [unclassified Colwellia]MBA6262376.1 hypothetical protein [Colwellia sp. Bg11-12]MBA6339637.1 hypothetical protein [Colwellia sp. MB02u-10]
MRVRVLLALLIPLQGCTIVGAALDEQLGIENKENQRDGTLAELGTQADIDLVRHIVTGEPLPVKKKPKGCSDLKGSRKTECINTVKLLNKSIDKHTKQ